MKHLQDQIGLKSAFFEEGRHAGPGGDIEQIVEGVMKKRPDLSIQTTAVLAGVAA